MFTAVSNIYKMQNNFKKKRRWNNRSDTALFRLFNRVVYNYEILLKRYQDHNPDLGIPAGVDRLLKDFKSLESRYNKFLSEVEIVQSTE